MQPPVGFRLASALRAHFPPVAEWRLRVSQRPADFAVQTQRVQRVPGQLHLIQERPEQRRARALLPWPPVLVLGRGWYWLWAGSVAPPRRRKA